MDEMDGIDEEGVVCQEGKAVRLGGVEYSVRPLPIRQAREWRKQYVEMAGMMGMDGAAADVDTLRTLFMRFPDAVVDLFFGWATDLPRETIEASATDEEICTGLEVVLQLAFPFVRALQAIGKTMAKQE